MKIYITRHGQTNLNKDKRMQGRVDEPLNDTGIAQAKAAREKLGDVKFDAVYSSPLSRAIVTASIIGHVNREDIVIDQRLIEGDFGKFDYRKIYLQGFRMTMFWALPEVFKAPKTVEPLESMIERSQSFFKELEQKGYENVLVVCHGGIIRCLCGYLADRSNGILWRPRPKNCEIRVYESINGKHSFIESIQ